jgi:ribosomal protein S18 acetylase RimI-like enzyme
MNQYKILSVKKEELPQCLKTIRTAFSITSQKYGFTKENYPLGGAFLTIDDLVKKFDSGVHMYAAWVDDKVAGYVQLEKTAPGVYSFQKFAVLPEFQKLGIGSSLIAFCKNKASVYGGHEIRLIMIYSNKELLSFYENNGFKLIKTKEDKDHPFVQGIMTLYIKNTDPQ